MIEHWQWVNVYNWIYIKYSLDNVSSCENAPFEFLNMSLILHCEKRRYRDANFTILYEDGTEDSHL